MVRHISTHFLVVSTNLFLECRVLQFGIPRSRKRVQNVGPFIELRNIKQITATQYRHRASTLYAQLDVSESHRSVFYKHMGHASEINSEVYQCPLAVTEITHVGRYLNDIDGLRIRARYLKCTFMRKHIMDEEDVSSALSLPTTQKQNVRNAKDGTLLLKITLITIKRERNQRSNTVVVYATCSGIYSRTRIWKVMQSRSNYESVIYSDYHASQREAND